MAGKYDPLGGHLRGCADDGLRQVVLTFNEIDRLVNGLPPSARQHRTWWANSSNVQAVAWQRAGWRVHAVDPGGRSVVFVTSQIGGGGTTGPRRDQSETHKRAARHAEKGRPSSSAEPPTMESVEAAVRFTWRDAGSVTLDVMKKATFPQLPTEAGLYHFTLIDRPGQGRPRVYIGETDNLRRRLAGNYRNPGASQQTNLRMNALLREHLAAGGAAHLAVATEATLIHGLASEQRPLDLTRKAARLLAESAAVVLAQVTDDADIENLG